MSRITTIFGVVLVLLGIGGYLGAGQQSLTALIPAALGVLLFVLGLVGSKDNMRKHAMHAAVALGFLGFLGSVRGLTGLTKLFRGEDVAKPEAVYAQSAMALLCLVFVGLCVKSFIDVRRKA